MPPPLLFHWHTNPADGGPEGSAFAEFCCVAESLGVESVYVAGSLPDALALATDAAIQTQALRFRVRSEPCEILEQASANPGSRLIRHIGPQAAESAAKQRHPIHISGVIPAPEIHVEGDSAEAAFLAIKYASLLWRSPDHPNQVYADALPVLHFGKAVGLATILIVRETRDEAIDRAAALFPTAAAERANEAPGGIAPNLWKIDRPGRNGTFTAMVGSFHEAAEWIVALKGKGISQFLFRACSDTRELIESTRAVIPLVRALENRSVTLA